MKASLRKWKKILVESFTQFQDDGCARFGASIAYSAVFSLAPLLVISIGIAGIVFGTTNAEAWVIDEAQKFLGQDGTLFIKEMVTRTQSTKLGTGFTAGGIFLLFVGAASLFKELKEAFNHVFDATSKQKGFLAFVKSNIFSFGMVLAAGFLLLISLILSAVLAALGEYFSRIVSLPVWFFELINLVISFSVTAGLFTLLYRYIPDKRSAWRVAFTGGVIAALLFTVGKTLIAFYIGRSGLASMYGAAGSIVLILLWIYYSSQMVLFGGKIAHVASLSGHRKKRER